MLLNLLGAVPPQHDSRRVDYDHDVAGILGGRHQHIPEHREDPSQLAGVPAEFDLCRSDVRR